MKPLIVSNPEVMIGKPVVAGTRVTVELVLEGLAGGRSREQLLAAYPRLSTEAIDAALAFTASMLRADTVYPTPDKAA